MPKSLAINHIRVKGDGTINVIFDKLSSDGDVNGGHSLTLQPGQSIEWHLAWLAKDTNLNGYDLTISASDIARIRAQSTASWTPENIGAVTAQVVAATQAQRDAEAAYAQAIADAKAKEAEATAATEAAKQAADALEAENARLAAAQAAKDAADKAAADKAAFDAAVNAKIRELIPV